MSTTNPFDLWQRYAAIWSLPTEARADELKACVVDEVNYCDPNSAIEGRDALSHYMGGFQSSVPGARFQIASVSNHHGRMLAHWALISADGKQLQTGASFALASDDGRLRNISGFFPLESM